MANFDVVSCNSGCCAVKHIRNIPDRPGSIFYLCSDGGHDQDQETYTPEPYENWAYPLDEKPATAGDAFREIVAQIKHRRPAGIITVNLVEEQEFNEDEGEFYFDDSQIRAWQPIMDELGFTKIVIPNSNSGNKIHHYTLAYDEGGWED